MKCAHCGMQNEDDAKFCDQCGASMAAKPVGNEEGEPPQRAHATVAQILGLPEDASEEQLRGRARQLAQFKPNRQARRAMAAWARRKPD